MNKKWIIILIATVIIIVIAIALLIGKSIRSDKENKENTNENKVLDILNMDEKEYFNSGFEEYEGVQSGKQVASMLAKLVANVGTYDDDQSMVPTLTVKTNLWNGNLDVKGNQYIYDGVDADTYTENIINLRNNVKYKEQYSIKLVYDNDTGIVKEIILSDN